MTTITMTTTIRKAIRDSDTTATRVTSTIPTTNFTATFSGDMNASTINGISFRTLSKGSTRQPTATV